ncbi:MAG: hypothetical protein LUC88_08735 [Prevotella sp.]|nr:hypothetical protein [Prevotella sp.]
MRIEFKNDKMRTILNFAATSINIGTLPKSLQYDFFVLKNQKSLLLSIKIRNLARLNMHKSLNPYIKHSQSQLQNLSTHFKASLLASFSKLLYIADIQYVNSPFSAYHNHQLFFFLFS